MPVFCNRPSCEHRSPGPLATPPKEPKAFPLFSIHNENSSEDPHHRLFTVSRLAGPQCPDNLLIKKSLFLIFCFAASAFQSHAVDVSVNLTRSGAPSETGFTNWETGDNSLPSDLSIAGLTLSAPITGINAGTTLRSINRGGNDGYGGTLSNLTQTWWGQRQSSTGPGGYITIDISGLSAGTYTFTSWHLDHEDQTGGMTIDFSDNDGSSFSTVVPSFDLLNYAGGGSVPVPADNAAAPYAATFDLVSTGADVQIRFRNNASTNSSTAFALVNGFSITGGGSGNAAPVFTSDPITGADATEDSPYVGTLAGTATDADDDPIVYAKVDGPAWLSVAGDGTLGGTPTNAHVGANSFTVSASDGIAPATQATLEITVINTNDAPVFAFELIYGNNGRAGVAYAGTLADYASDDEGDILTFAKVSGPAWLSVAGDGSLTGTPQIGDLGSNDFIVSVTDNIAPPVEATLRILITDTNAAPVFTADPIPGAGATQGVVYSGTLDGSATDSDGDPLAYAKVGGPAWLSVAGDGGLSGTPGPGDTGANAFTVSVTDGIIATPVEAALNITVDPFTLPGGIVFVDAVEGSGGNTFATGGSPSDTSWIASQSGSEQVNFQWKKRAFGSSRTVFASYTTAADSQVELTTRVAPPVDGKYDIYVFFWDASGGSSNFWDIAAGLNSGLTSSDIYSFDGPGDTVSPVPASTLTFDPANEPTVMVESDRTLYAVRLGTVTVSGGSPITVYVDDLTNGSSGNRTWYDGIGYELLLDTDGDGFPDHYELLHTDPPSATALNREDDRDQDGIDNWDEFQNGTNPSLADTDGDGLLDGGNITVTSSDSRFTAWAAEGILFTDAGAQRTFRGEAPMGTDPLNPDTDGDGLSDGVETDTGIFVDAGNTGTDPLNPDTDGDGIPDGIEVANATDPMDATDPIAQPAGTPLQIAPDGVWTWFNDERAIWHLGKLYAGYVKKNGKVGISRFDPATLATTHAELSGFTQVDDHNNPSITVLPDNRLMVVYSLHNGSAFRRISNVTEPATISDWGNEISTYGTSYANTYRLTGESNRIYHFSRAINWNPTLTISDDNGATFGPQIHFIATGSGSKRPYPKYVSNGTDRIDLIYTDGHPRNENNSIYHLFYQGGNFMKTDGSLLKAIGDLPILHDSGERGTEVYTYSSAAWGPEDGPDDWIPNGRGWTWDICYGNDGHPACAFQVQLDDVTGSGWNHDRIYYYYARWTGTGWQRRFIAHGGRGIYSSEDDYGGGMAIDPDHPNVVYISTNAADPFNLGDLSNVPVAANDRYEIWQGTTTDGGLTFSWQPITVGSASDNLRPIVPKNHGYDRSVVWFRGNYTSYTNYNTEVVGIFQNQLRLLDHDVAPGGGLLRWTSSPGKNYRIMGSVDLQGFPHEVVIDIDSQGAETSQAFPIPAPLSGSPRAFFRVEEQ
jgi:hypothetical protein